jgi:hypothetical protein
MMSPNEEATSLLRTTPLHFFAASLAAADTISCFFAAKPPLVRLPMRLLARSPAVACSFRTACFSQSFHNLGGSTLVWLASGFALCGATHCATFFVFVTMSLLSLCHSCLVCVVATRFKHTSNIVYSQSIRRGQLNYCLHEHKLSLFLFGL